MKNVALLMAFAVCGFAVDAEASHGYRYGMTSIGFPTASYSADRGYQSQFVSYGQSCGCEAPACDTGCNDCCNAWDGFCQRKRCHLKGLLHRCKPACCEPVCCEPIACEPTCCEPEPCCGPCKKRCRLFSGLFKCHKSSCGCEVECCEPAPCCEPEPCCDPCGKRCKLFSGLFKCRKPACGCECGDACGCGGAIDHGYEVHESEAVPAAPAAPEPVDPTAFRGGLFQVMPVSFGR